MSAPSVIVVDDEAPIREFLGDLLADLGLHVRLAINGRQALALASAERPDLVISDVMMPVMGGTDLCRRLKADLHPAPVVILTSAAEPPSTQAVGADGFVRKPFDLSEVERVVRELMSLPARDGR